MPRPLLSGFCTPGNPPHTHTRCRLEGCTCYCHAPQTAQVTPPPDNMPAPPAPRVKVSLACLQGRHTDACGHLEQQPVELVDGKRTDDSPHGSATTMTLGEALATQAANLDVDDGDHRDRRLADELEDAGERLGVAHNHTWQPLTDPHGLYQGKAYVCTGPLGGGCGATMDDHAVYPFGTTPATARGTQAELGSGTPAAAATYVKADGLEPPGVQTAIDEALPLEVELTTEERRQVIAGHLVLDPAAILEAVRVIVQNRLNS